MPDQETFELATGAEPVTGTVIVRGTPLNAGRRPIAVVVDGGANAPIDSWGVAAPLIDGLADAGFVAACFDWPDLHSGASTTAEQCLAIAERVLTWLVDRDDLDAERLAIAGTGIGALFTAALAGRCDSVRAAALARPVTGRAIVGRNGRPSTDAPLLGSDACSAAFIESLELLSPEQDLARHPITTLLLSGASDRAAPPEAAAPYLTALEAAGRDVTSELIAMAGEDAPAAEIGPVIAARIVRFFAHGLAPAEAGAAK
jgi:dienelactone hydrolase